MATVEVLTRERMEAIEAEAIVDARIDIEGDERHLVLIRNNGVEVSVGDVRGPIGLTPTVPDEINWRHTGLLSGSSPVGGTGVPALKFQAGTTLVTTNTEGRELISFSTAFLGVSSVIAQVGQTEGVIFSHLNGGGAGIYGVNAAALQLVVSSVTVSNFLLTVAYGSGAAEFGLPIEPVRVGGSTDIRVNWMAFGW